MLRAHPSLRAFLPLLVLLLAANLLAARAANAAEPVIRVAVTPPQGGGIRVEGEALIASGRANASPNAPTRTVAGPAKSLTLGWANGGWEIDGNPVGMPVVRLHSDDGLFHVGGKLYQGDLEAFLTPERQPRLALKLPLETYLLGVVRHEVDPSWTQPLLKTQAVLARTYAMRRLLDRKEQPFDVETDTRDQVFGGLEDIPEAVREAVLATRGEVVLYEDQPIHAFYHSTCGGHTEDAAEVFWPLPYAHGKPDIYCMESPRSFWKLELSQETLVEKFSEPGRRLRQPVTLEILERTASGRAGQIMVKDPESFQMFTGNEFRKRIGYETLRGANFEIRRKEDGSYKLLGTGSGHGVGLCQWGAKAMAEKGFDYLEIIGYYYDGVTAGKRY